MRAQAFIEGEDPARHWVRSIGAVQDITERKEAEEQLTQTATGSVWLSRQDEWEFGAGIF